MNLRYLLKSCIILGFFIGESDRGLSQDQRIADSLKSIYTTGEYSDASEFEILHELAFNEQNDYDLALSYAGQLILLASNEGNLIYLHRGYLQKGRINRLKGNFEVAFDCFFKSIDAAEKAGYDEGIGGAYINIADIYSISDNSTNAIKYYNQAIEILRNSPDSTALATALLNAGDEYFNSGNYDDALRHFEESGQIFKNVNYLIGTAYNLGNTGMVYAEQGKDQLAQENITQAITMLEELKDFYPISVYLITMSDIYIKQHDLVTALTYTHRSLELATRYGLKDQISDANLKLAELYDQQGNQLASYRYYKHHIAYRDSVTNIETVRQMANLRTDFEVSQKQAEVDLLEKESLIAQLRTKRQKFVIYATVISLIVVALLALGALNRYQYIKKTKRIIEEEKNRSEDLLLNILPKETAMELMENGKVKAKKFSSVTVLFTDFKEFTKLVEHVEPEQLIRSIDYYFKKFDEITTRYGLEKIKTIGDAYMCAGGLPTVSTTHARNVILAAKEMIELVNKKRDAQDDLIHFEIRIGIHTGPVVAGIVGLKKWQYDIWGDTVNIASRMESNSASGMVNLSESTYHEIKDEFDCTYRGEIEVKNHGPVKMYFLS
jgi:adenylate cyclase